MADHPVLVTVGLLLILGGVFLAGFSEAVGVAVPLVLVFLLLNLVVAVVGGVNAVGHPVDVHRWLDAAARGRRPRRRSRSPRCWRSRCWCWACPGSRPACR